MKITSYNIELRNIHIYAHHGVLEQERSVGAQFTLDVTLSINEHSCAFSDDINGTVSYADLYALICKEMQTPSRLLEHVCQRILNSIFEKFPTVNRATVTLCKDTPPMGGDRLNAAVTLSGTR